MNKPLKILHLEDMQEDAELVSRELRKSGLISETLLVNQRDDFTKALKEFSPDIIISDHSLPSFNSHEALKIVRGFGIDVPFILVTATVSEEYAVNIIKEGATDYILKDRLQRLPNAIKAAIHKYNLEKMNEQASEILRASERKYKLLFESNPMPMWMISQSTLQIIEVNEAAVKHYGYSKEDFLKINSKTLLPDEDIDEYVRYPEEKNPDIYKSGIWRHKRKDGAINMVDVIAHDVIYEDKPARLVLANDITEKLQAEAELAQQRILQQKLIAETNIRAQEKEREEIGKELHDNICQILATAKLYLEYAIKKNDFHSEELEKSRENINLTISEIRKLSHALVAPSLSDNTLAGVIQRLLDDIRAISLLQTELITENYTETAIDNDIKLMFYRIVQEQMNNILKHAKASKATVKISITDNDICLSIKDDGVGFDTGKNSAGIGLRNMTNRVIFYDGTIHISSSPGKGCTLKVIIPA